jgi:hypothetical protein
MKESQTYIQSTKLKVVQIFNSMSTVFDLVPKILKGGIKNAKV